MKEAPQSATGEERARGMRGKIQGLLGGLKKPAQNPRSGSRPGRRAAAGQDQCVRNSIIPSSPYEEQETTQGHCQCLSDQDPDCNANDGPQRETCGAASI